MLKATIRSETKMRLMAERKNIDVSHKLAEARRGLQDTRNALLKVQGVTDDLMNRRDQRDAQLQKAVALNKAYERKMADIQDAYAQNIEQMSEKNDSSMLMFNESSHEASQRFHAIVVEKQKHLYEKEEIINKLEDRG